VALARVLVAPRTWPSSTSPPTTSTPTPRSGSRSTCATEFPGAVLLMTHDRFFLDRVVTRIVEIDRGVAFSYDGNYTTYIAPRPSASPTRRSTESGG
jgi:ATP-binding cassette subfamily F protein uup